MCAYLSGERRSFFCSDRSSGVFGEEAQGLGFRDGRREKLVALRGQRRRSVSPRAGIGTLGGGYSARSDGISGEWSVAELQRAGHRPQLHVVAGEATLATAANRKTQPLLEICVGRALLFGTRHELLGTLPHPRGSPSDTRRCQDSQLASSQSHTGLRRALLELRAKAPPSASVVESLGELSS